MHSGEQKWWAEVMGNVKCNMLAHAVSNRKKVVKFHLDELKSERYWWRNTLIGSVCRAIPRFQEIERFAMS